MSNIAAVHRALDAIAAGDLAGVMRCLADEVVFEFPYSENGTVLDKAGSERIIGFVIRTFTTRTFEVTGVHEVVAPDQLVIEYRSEFRADAGVDYDNSYVAIFEFRHGLITRWREYANPIPFARAMAAIQAASD